MIYLDANASSRLRPAAAAALRDWVTRELGNASSVHRAGRAARAALNEARRELLGLLGSSERRAQVVFTSGGTEACNALITGFTATCGAGHIVSSAFEHAAVREPLNRLVAAGWVLAELKPEADGIVGAESFHAACRKDTGLVVLMAANNESGAVQPVSEVAGRLRRAGYSGPIVSDVTQAVGKTALDLDALFEAGVNAVAVSGHKFGAMQGIGALVIARSANALCLPFHPMLLGGPQEQRLRAGTENVPGACTMGAAARELSRQLGAELERIAALRERLWSGLQREVPAIFRLTPLGEGTARALSNTLLCRLEGCRGDDLVVALDLLGVCASSGAACSSGRQAVSPVAAALGLSGAAARELLRLSLDWDATELEIDRAVQLISGAVQRMRQADRQERAYA